MGIDPQTHLNDAGEDPLAGDATRRSFLKKVAVGGAAAAVGSQLLPVRAFAQDAEGDESTTTAAEAPAEGGEEETIPLTPDEELVGFLVSVAWAASASFRAAAGDEAESAAADEEAAAEDAAAPLAPITVVTLSEPLVELVRTFGAEHAGQAEALNGLLVEPITVPNGTLLTEVRSQLDAAADEAAVLAVLRDLDERIAATHLDAIGTFEDVNDTKAAAAALPVVSQQIVALGRIVEPPVALPELVPVEQTTEGALDPAAYPVDAAEAPAATPAPTTTPGDDSPEGGEGADAGATSEPTGDGTESGGATSTESEG